MFLDVENLCAREDVILEIVGSVHARGRRRRGMRSCVKRIEGMKGFSDKLRNDVVLEVPTVRFFYGLPQGRERFWITAVPLLTVAAHCHC
ncbi:hypothetical protein SLEP1_g25910 [Rubroshorea leprosula]|uniref:Uncharacterized protein n=1 Tax=Rubroshorea leprosula TaxID=152421 RepID=A0AAV5JKM9_9ROSI|nr:hypothetical protein SLEP1_g25910 [Rubroshorea leprosula]